MAEKPVDVAPQSTPTWEDLQDLFQYVSETTGRSVAPFRSLRHPGKVWIEYPERGGWTEVDEEDFYRQFAPDMDPEYMNWLLRRSGGMGVK